MLYLRAKPIGINISRFILFQYGVIHILRNHQGGGGFPNDYANVIFALSNAEIDYGRGRGLETDKQWLRNMWTAPMVVYF